MRWGRIALVGLVLACAHTEPAGPQAWIPPGAYRVGSPPVEREWAYKHSPEIVRAQRWYDIWEQPPTTLAIRGFWIDRTPVTQAEYAEFVQTTGRRSPGITREQYTEQGFLVHPYEDVEPYVWNGSSPPQGLESHPVVLVSQGDAQAYCLWHGRRLPGAEEWESACRGSGGRLFPWGNAWSRGRAHTDAMGTAPVGTHPEGATPEDIQDLAGNVFEWTASPFGNARVAVKGCAWDDAPGSCRCAFRHGRPADSRHILVGFRCIEPGSDDHPPPS